MANDFSKNAVAIIFLGITAAIGSVIMLSWRDSQLTSLGTYTVYNESVTPVTGGTEMSVGWCSTVDSCMNQTGQEVIEAANYTVTVDAVNGWCEVANLTGNEFIPAENPWNCTYTVYNISDPRFALPNETAIGLLEYGSWFKIIVIVVVAGGLLFFLNKALSGASQTM